VITKRPVKVALPFEEMFYTITRHPTIPHQERGRRRRPPRAPLRVFWNGGAYADVGPRVAQVRVHRVGPLRDRQRVDRFYALYTNQRRPALRLRRPQLVWA
jgi:CO/xanthine dehydrogenase Mo-binding subunit